MHYKDFFNKAHYNNQEIFNKKLNWFFDIKNCVYSNFKKKKVEKDAKQLIKEFRSLKNIETNKKDIYIKTKKIDFKKFLKPNRIKFNTKVIRSLNYLKENNIKYFFKYFLIQGSFATSDYVENWSDFDTFVVIKKEIFKSSKYLIKLRKILKSYYKLVLKFSNFQHHGLIIYTEYDLNNYKIGFLPTEALEKKNLNLFNSDKIKFQKLLHKKMSLSKNILLDRCKYIKKGIKNKYYDHHVFGKKKLSIPLVENEKTLKQLFSQISFILNIPILVLDCLNRSSHKKSSFSKFYRICKNAKINEFIKKHEYLRKNWNDYAKSKSYISKDLKIFLGKNYFKKCLETINYCNKFLIN
jgi:hypothetical protein